jgi:hypothetical protein
MDVNEVERLSRKLLYPAGLIVLFIDVNFLVTSTILRHERPSDIHSVLVPGSLSSTLFALIWAYIFDDTNYNVVDGQRHQSIYISSWIMPSNT